MHDFTPPPEPSAWLLNGEEILLEGWHASFGAGGPLRAGGAVEATVARRLEQGDELLAVVGDEPKWGGQVSLDSLALRGKGRLEAAGYVGQLMQQSGRLLYQSRDVSGFVARSGPPWNIGDEVQHFGAEAKDSHLLFTIGQGQPVVDTEHQSLVFAAPGVPELTRYAFDWRSKNATMVLVLKVFGGHWPADTQSAIATLSLNAASGSEDLTFGGGLDAAGGFDELMIQLLATANFTASFYYLQIYNWRVNGIAPGDVFTTSGVVADIGERQGFDTIGVEASSVNALPFDLKSGNWWDAGMRHMAFLDDRPPPGIFPQRRGDPVVRYGEWGDVVHVVYLGHDVEPQLNPLAKVNGVVVHYKHVGGYDAQTEVIRPADIGVADPLAGKKDADSFQDITFPGDQLLPDDRLPLETGRLALRRLVRPRVDGFIDLAAVQDATPWDVHNGHILRAANFAALESRDLPVESVELRQGAQVRVNIHEPAAELADAYAARIGLEQARAFRNPALPALELLQGRADIQAAPHKHMHPNPGKKMHHRQYHSRRHSHEHDHTPMGPKPGSEGAHKMPPPGHHKPRKKGKKG